MINFKSLQESSFSNIFNKIIWIFFLKVALGSAHNLIGILFHSFAAILYKTSSEFQYLISGYRNS